MSTPTPEPMTLNCPDCGTQHVDRLDPATGIDWSQRPHRTHLCARCKLLWRPFPYPTVGVLAVRVPVG